MSILFSVLSIFLVEFAFNVNGFLEFEIFNNKNILKLTFFFANLLNFYGKSFKNLYQLNLLSSRHKFWYFLSKLPALKWEKSET